MRSSHRTLATLLLAGNLLTPIAAMAQHTTSPAPVPAVPPATNMTSGGTHTPPGFSTTTPAPVPTTPPEQVTPSERIEGAGPGGQSYSAGPAGGTPFSADPSGTQPSDDRSGPHSREYPAGGVTDSPNLSK